MKNEHEEAQDRFMTTGECAKILKRHPGNIRKEIKEGKLPAILSGRVFLVDREDFEKYIQTLRVKPSA